MTCTEALVVVVAEVRTLASQSQVSLKAGLLRGQTPGCLPFHLFNPLELGVGM